jgi:hypothetical protein
VYSKEYLWSSLSSSAEIKIRNPLIFLKKKLVKPRDSPLPVRSS